MTFNLPKEDEVTLIITDVAGKEYLRIADHAVFPAGTSSMSLPLNQLEEGMYFCNMITSDRKELVKVLVIR